MLGQSKTETKKKEDEGERADLSWVIVWLISVEPLGIRSQVRASLERLCSQEHSTTDGVLIVVIFEKLGMFLRGHVTTKPG